MNTILYCALILLLALYCWADTERRSETDLNKTMSKECDSLKIFLNECRDDLSKLKLQMKKDLESAIKYSLSRCRTKEDKNELFLIITENLYYVGKINTVTDFFEYDIKYIIKICLYANKGYLDVYYNYTEEDERPFVILENEKKVYITKSVAQDMHNNRYDFVLDILEERNEKTS